ncbi:Protein ImuB [Alteripontixanthobacter maritimus]|uniref:Protein ImuB n=2 Tax=Alteripontixanthobacter maritimus TaxID=2161824 RepID=A0A369QCG6_9SPHN|nr:Protein ImuB [Alteripontixanthobacter maritimus]
MAMDLWRKKHGRPDDGTPLVLVSEGTHGTVIDAASTAALHAGAKCGQRLTDARAICPALVVEQSNHASDAAWLERLTGWAHRWSPWTAMDGMDGLLIDATGAAHCFGGEAAMQADMRARFTAMGFVSHVAIAPTIGGAWALARFGSASGTANVDRADLTRALAPLPIECLRIDTDVILLLRRVGLKTVGALADIPTLALARRFRSLGLAKRFASRKANAQANPLHRLQQALGHIEETVAPLAERTVYRAQSRVLEPIRHLALLEPLLADLATDLCDQLFARQQGLRRVRFEAFRVDGHIAVLNAETASPIRIPDHIARLFSEGLQTLDAGFGFDAFALTALWHEDMAALQAALDEEPVKGIALPQLIDRLSARIGADRVSRPVPYASHVPERSVGWRSALQGELDFAPPAPSNERPIRLFDRPEIITVIYATPEGPPRRFRWRRVLHDVVKVEGPERIAPEWWRERSTARLRDYYKVEDEAGRRFWIFRGGVVDDGRGGPPQWFMHGLFA